MSSAWIFLLLAFVVAMMVGPVMLMQPSSRERRQARVRAIANRSGYNVSTPSWPASLPVTPGGAMRYTAPWQTSQNLPSTCLLVRRDYQHELHVADNWHKHPSSANVAQPLIDWLSQGDIDPAIVAVGCNPEGVFVDWREQDTAEVQRVLQQLQQLRQQLSPAGG